MIRRIGLLGSIGLLLSLQAVVGPVRAAAGADVIVAELQDIRVVTRQAGDLGLFVTTVSCNVGDTPVNWFSLGFSDAARRTQHPLITQNFYRMADGRLEQIGQSGVKHGFTALQNGGLCPKPCNPYPPMARGWAWGARIRTAAA
jgi:hypothetical protein